MSSKKLVWDEQGKRFYETGVEKGVLYNYEEGAYKNGVAWNGLTAVTESPSGAESTPMYADNIKYLNLTSVEEFNATIEAYTYPDEFKPCIGEVEISSGVTIAQQAHKTFGLSYQTKLGNDVDGSDHGYKIHLVYGCSAKPTEKGYQTINDSPEAMTFSWELSTVPIKVSGHKPTAILTIDSTKVTKEKMELIENALYGTDTTEPKLLTPDEVLKIIAGTV